jgi:hypothetical protein
MSRSENADRFDKRNYARSEKNEIEMIEVAVNRLPFLKRWKTSVTN